MSWYKHGYKPPLYKLEDGEFRACQLVAEDIIHQVSIRMEIRARKIATLSVPAPQVHSHANKTALKITPTFVIEKMENVLANPIILVEPVIRVKMDTLIILVVKIADALQTIPTIHIMSVVKKMANLTQINSKIKLRWIK